MLHSVRMDAEASAMEMPDPSDPSDPRWPAWITLAFVAALRGDEAPPGLLEKLVARDAFEGLTNPAMVAIAAAVKVDGRVERPAPGVAHVRLITAEVVHGAADAKVGVPTVVLEQTDAIDNGMAGWVITRLENPVHTVRTLRPAHEREDYIKSRWQVAEDAIDDAHEAASALGRYWDRDFERLAMPTGRALLAMIEALVNLDDLARQEGGDLVGVLNEAAAFDHTAGVVAHLVGWSRELTMTQCSDPNCKHEHPM